MKTHGYEKLYYTLIFVALFIEPSLQRNAKKNSCGLYRKRGKGNLTPAKEPFSSCRTRKHGTGGASSDLGLSRMKLEPEAVLALTTSRTTLHRRGLWKQATQIPSSPYQYVKYYREYWGVREKTPWPGCIGAMSESNRQSDSRTVPCCT